MYDNDYNDFENPHGYPEVGVSGQIGVRPDFMEKSDRYGGHPVDSGGGMVNDPDYQNKESDINKSLQKQMLAEQLRSQGFDVAEATVQPYIGEHMVYMKEQDNINQYGEVIPAESEKFKFDDKNLFPPMPGYHLSYFANMAFYIPEAYGLDNVMTNAVWLNRKEGCYMRYLALTITYIQLIPIVGRAFARGTILYAMKPNVAFPNKLQVDSCKEPLVWDSIISDDATGHGNKMGLVTMNGWTSQILQGTEVISVKGEAPVDSGLSGQFDKIRQGSESIAKSVEVVLRRLFKDYDIVKPKKRRKKKKARKSKDPFKEFFGGGY